MEFLPWEIRVAFPGESQLRQSRATQPTVHAGCYSVSIIHRTLTWTTGSLTCAQMLIVLLKVYRIIPRPMVLALFQSHGCISNILLQIALFGFFSSVSYTLYGCHID